LGAACKFQIVKLSSHSIQLVMVLEMLFDSFNNAKKLQDNQSSSKTMWEELHQEIELDIKI
jgi:hypothetical protein